jgi:hypothetical protein
MGGGGGAHSLGREQKIAEAYQSLKNALQRINRALLEAYYMLATG